ncbi:DEKNAAC100090 [Brettanomyces naardenensis]|uniref:DEKNAAC100090 n=1 Tax=Brettanomyces naardenensis TaxID=13370 RepID=A0A448YFZ0_BRENA|nr:DEKNAAC100090 [Brettanomyces naardenensis]
MSSDGNGEFFHLPVEVTNEDDKGVAPKRESEEGEEDHGNQDSSAPLSLEALGVRFVEQNSLERSVAERADKEMAKKDVELENKRLARALNKLNKLKGKLKSLQAKFGNGYVRISEKERLRGEIEKLESEELLQASTDVKEIRERLAKAQVLVGQAERQQPPGEEELEAAPKAVDDAEVNFTNVKQLPGETQQEYLIRTGKVTAFGSANGFIEELDEREEDENVPSHQNLRVPGFQEVEEEVEREEEKHNKKCKIATRTSPVVIKDEDEDYIESIDVGESEGENDEDIYYENQEVQSESDENIDISVPKHKLEEEEINEEEDFKNIDDGDEQVYRRRFKQWSDKRSVLRKLKRPDYEEDPNKPEWEKPHPSINDAILNDEFRIPGDIYPLLFDYQKTGVQWLWELFSQRTGGIVGDEMGLGKTVQIIAFLAGLQYTGHLKRPVLIVCPATVLRQWCNEFHRWWPAFRTVILHSIGSGMNGKRTKHEDSWEQEEELWDDMLEKEDYTPKKSAHSAMNDRRAKELVDRVSKKGHVIITTYVGLRIYSKFLLPIRWEYVVLDEGHKIRNPDSYITLTCKQLRTPNRIILSGTPIQNNLVELWSLFDFIFPGRLGTLPVFQKQFCIPINLGGYANATNVQVQTGYKCAVILKDLVSPYLLRRVKADVAQDLPKKSEMVLFCKLTAHQRALYENFLHSEDLQRILKGKRNALYGIDVLRKICNHPDLVAGVADKDRDIVTETSSETAKSMAEKSGKLQVVSTLIQVWNKENRKTLVFTQTRQMLNILEEFVRKLNQENDRAYGYLRMDGTTPVSERQKLVDAFNEDPEYKVFLLTTRVGGLGVNLTGASRVIIYDPDWNPSTDIQARERAWRLGQKKDVTIYRLMIAGSIEEKIYHRQIFKQFLTNKILKDPKQKRFFKMTDMYDLFTLGDQDTKGTETADLFGARETNYEGTKERKSRYLSGARKGRQVREVGDDDFMKVSKLRGVAGVQKYDAGEGIKSNDDDDTGFVSQIFKRSGVHSALEHDSILNQGSETAPSYDVIEGEANRIAREAVQALRSSRRAAREAGIAVPTWTGRFGAAGRTADANGLRPKRRRLPIPGKVAPGLNIRQGSTGLSSSSILKLIERKKNDVGTLRPIDRRLGSHNTALNQKRSIVDDEQLTQKLVTDLSSYMSGLNGYFSTSSDILDHLHVDVLDEKEVKVLRSMLRNICKWDKTRRGWVLNEEFR